MENIGEMPLLDLCMSMFGQDLGNVAYQMDQAITQYYMMVHTILMGIANSFVHSGVLPDDYSKGVTRAARTYHETVMPIVQQTSTGSSGTVEKDLPVYNVLNHISFNVVIVWIGFGLAYGVAAGVWWGWTQIEAAINAANL